MKKIFLNPTVDVTLVKTNIIATSLDVFEGDTNDGPSLMPEDFVVDFDLL